MSRINEIKKMLKTDKDDSFLSYALALEYEKEGDQNTAIQLIEELIKKDPNYLGAYYKLGHLYENKNKMGEAIKIYNTGIKLANEKNDNKTKGELEEALWLIDDDQQ